MIGRRSTSLAIRRGFWLATGYSAVVFAAFGVVLPVLPTTPFLLVAAFAFGKSSPRLQAWLENSATFGSLIADWRANGAIAPRTKAVSVATMAGFFCFSIAMGFSAIVLIIQAVAMGGAAIFILTRPNGVG
ncbi:MAG: YbaN family protein [Pseudomonadota bacterium]